MAKLVSGRVVAALAAGAAGGWFASYLWASSGGRGLRPAVKEAVKVGLDAVDRGRQFAAEWSETVSDLVAEAQAERRVLAGPLTDDADAAGK